MGKEIQERQPDLSLTISRGNHIIPLTEDFQRNADDALNVKPIIDEGNSERRLQLAGEVGSLFKTLEVSGSRYSVVAVLDGAIEVARVDVRRKRDSFQTVFLYKYEIGKKTGELLGGTVQSITAVKQDNLDKWSREDLATFDSRSQKIISIYEKNGSVFQRYIPFGYSNHPAWKFEQGDEIDSESNLLLAYKKIRAYLEEFPAKHDTTRIKVDNLLT